MTKPVSVYKWWRPEDSKYDVPYERKYDYAAKFHQFGVDYEELESGVGTFSTAIVEKVDGTIKNVPVEMVKFHDA